MNKKNQKRGDKLSVTLRKDILNLFSENKERQLNYKQVSSFLNVSDKQVRKLVFEILTDLCDEGALKETQRGKYKLDKQDQLHVGVLTVIRRGDGFVNSPDMEDDIYVDEKNMTKALNGDSVKVKILKKRGKTGYEGKIVEVLNQKSRLIVGTLDIQDHFAFLNPDDHRINVDLFIPTSSLNGGKNGFKAIAQITDWPDSAKNPFGKVVEVLGKPESNDAEMKAILAGYGISYTFPDEVLNEANQVSLTLDPKEIEKRRDYRDILTFTIDPIDAKDFDDAISVEFLDGGNVRVGVHIADVAHYVTEGSALDKEAAERGNSVYLVDRVIPMLPEHLSNGVCSLRPNEEKFAFSAIFDLTNEGEIVDEWFGKTAINSDRRFTYEEAQEVIETGKGDHSKEILLVDSIAKKMRVKRMQEGALEIHGSELRFKLDDNGHPEEVFKKTQKDANKLVEEYMLLANRRVGKYIGDVKRKTVVPLIYRVHDKPDMEKVQQFAIFVSKFGKSFKYNNETEIAKNMNALFAEMKDENEFALVQQMAIRTMSKAIYDTENIGHYGLGFRYYAHFTSPIRRYADLMVHRVLHNELQKSNAKYKGMSQVAEHISATERRASEAERASKKFFQALYLADKEGEVFAGKITGLTEWGMYVEMEDNYCEGMVSLKSIRGDNFQFDQKDYVVYGTKRGEKFNLGDRVFVKVTKVSVNRKQVDLELMD
ncbi:MAG: ribonuclease R [Arenicella sp.]|jgi:ribonuclease R